jgi:tetratricopeptide (TPR) repeat protein
MAGKNPKNLLPDFLGDRAVLVVEPSINYRSSIKQFLTNLRAKRIKLVASVADARREMLTTKVGLFIVEWGLDGQNGLQFCRSLRKELAYKDAPFILLSTENLRQDVILASEVRIDGYLLKPFSYEDFVAQVRSLVQAYETPSKIRTLLTDGDALLARGDAVAAEVCYQEALTETQGSSARALCGLARIRRLEDKVNDALELLSRAVKHNPDFIEAYRTMLEIHEEADNRTASMQVAGILHALSPDNPRYTLILAKGHLEMGGLEASESFFKKTIALSPRLAEAFKGLGNVYLAKEEYEKAMKSFTKALDLDEDDVSTLNSLGTAYIRLGNYKEGIDRYMLALRLDPHDSRILFNIGHAHEKRSDYEKAKWYYAQALIHRAGFAKAARGLERLEKIASGAVETDDDPETVTEILKKSS